MDGEHDGADPEAVAMADRSGRRDPAGSDGGAVLAPEIRDRDGRAGDRDRRVTARHALTVETHRRLRRAADDVLAFPEGRLPTAPREPDHAGIWRGWTRGVAQRIAETLHRADEPRRRRRVAERPADLGDEVREVLLDHERVGPQALLQRLLGERLRPRRDEQE